jgi:hypothetical protein
MKLHAALRMAATLMMKDQTNAPIVKQ